MQVKRHLINCAVFFCTLGLICITLEIMFRFLPVSTGIKILPVNSHAPVFHAQPDSTIQYSLHWKFDNAKTKRVNNAGFINDQDYIKESNVPLIAVVGDSYIEAMQVASKDAYPGLLQAASRELRVYSFGFSGAQLSQYLVWAQHAKQEFDNQYLIINIVSNDFDESLAKYYSFVPGFHVYTDNAQGQLQLTRLDWQPNKYKEYAKKSHLLSYLVRNLEIAHTKDRLKAALGKASSKTVPNIAVDANKDQQRINDSYAVIDAFFRDLPHYSGLPAQNILFVLDDRTGIYENSVSHDDRIKHYLQAMKNYFSQQANLGGYTVIDMAEPFRTHYQHNHEHFEFAYDWHWNALGHQVVAQTILTSEWWHRLDYASNNSSLAKRSISE